ncbi:MAG: serine/threonine protein kinase [Deltaproteobacteria bacterium]|nr:serine/threonine protein kinase [Deltaproteobacteria bacterium]
MAKVFGEYKLIRPIAIGGMGEVYLAVLEREGGLAKAVALKMMLPSAEKRAGFGELFQGEATVAAMLNHVNIIQIFDHGCIAGRSFLTMEYVEGPDLGALICACKQQPFPGDVTAEIGIQLCRGMGHAHERKDFQGRPMGIVHGDVSPANILVSNEGQVKLADFGLARVRSAVAGEGLITGKYSYMSPEQARGAALTAQSDLYSLGLVVYEMLTAQRVFPIEDPQALTLVTIQAGAAAALERLDPSLEESWKKFLATALATDPKLRFRSAGEMSRALLETCALCGPEKLAEFVQTNTCVETGVQPLAPEPTELAQKPVSPTGHAMPVWLITLVALFVVGWGAGISWWVFHTKPSARPAPPTSSLPRAPQGLKLQLPPKQTETIVDAPLVIDTKKPKISEPNPDVKSKNSVPRLTISFEPGFRAQLDHRRIKGSKLQIAALRPHLIHLVPIKDKQPRITIRLNPPPEGMADWALTLNSKPWMKITLNGQPAGQTPRSRLRIKPGRSNLIFHRKNLSVKLELNVIEPE